MTYVVARIVLLFWRSYQGNHLGNFKKSGDQLNNGQGDRESEECRV
jgi:hypothetical protein